jgi:hypothetical protein
MILASIHYHVFPGEAESLEAEATRNWHQLDGELRLEFTDRPACFVSWGSRPVLYSVEVSNASFFAEHLLGSVEMTDHPYWSELIGHELRLSYAAADHQVLKFATPGAEVFLSSQHQNGAFQGDSLRVSPVAPAFMRETARGSKADAAIPLITA